MANNPHFGTCDKCGAPNTPYKGYSVNGKPVYECKNRFACANNIQQAAQKKAAATPPITAKCTNCGVTFVPSPIGTSIGMCIACTNATIASARAWVASQKQAQAAKIPTQTCRNCGQAYTPAPAGSTIFCSNCVSGQPPIWGPIPAPKTKNPDLYFDFDRRAFVFNTGQFKLRLSLEILELIINVCNTGEPIVFTGQKDPVSGVAVIEAKEFEDSDQIERIVSRFLAANKESEKEEDK